MYWEAPTSELAEAVEMLRRFAHEWLGPGRDPLLNDGLWGCGFFAVQGESLPVVLVDEDRLFPPAGRNNWPSLSSAEDLVWFTQLSAADVLAGALGMNTKDVGLPPETRAVPLPRPEPMSLSTGAPIRETVSPYLRGTVGLPVERTDDSGQRVSGFITAGHCCASGGIGSTFEAIHPHILGRTTYTPAGTVALYENPADSPGAPGWDVAVVDSPTGSAKVTAPTTHGVASLNGVLPMPEPVDAYGGISGTVPAELVGALFTAGDPTVCQWLDTWVLVPSGATVQGDSGGAVIQSSTSQSAAMIVAEARRKYGKRSQIVQFAQDMESLQTSWLTPNNVTLV